MKRLSFNIKSFLVSQIPKQACLPKSLVMLTTIVDCHAFWSSGQHSMESLVMEDDIKEQFTYIHKALLYKEFGIMIF